LLLISQAFLGENQNVKKLLKTPTTTEQGNGNEPDGLIWVYNNEIHDLTYQ
jgi:hypothetical protein